MKDQADKNTSQLNSLFQLYYVIISKLSFNSNPSINPSIKFCENMLNEIYKKHSKDKNSKSTKLTIINADNNGLLADCDIFKESIIELSADGRAILIKQKTLNKNTEWILICLSEGKVIVSKTVPNICNNIRDKKFDFQCLAYRELMKCNNNILDKKNEENDCKNLNQNKNELSNNSNIYKEKEPENKEKEHEDKKNIINNVSQNELENDLKNEISVEKDDQNMRLPKKQKKKKKKVNFNEKIDVIDVESFKTLNHAPANNDDNDKEEKNDIIGGSNSYDASNMKKNNKNQEKPDSNNDNNKMNNLNSNNEDAFTGTNFEGEAKKAKNDCNCCLDCSGRFKRIFGG